MIVLLVNLLHFLKVRYSTFQNTTYLKAKRCSTCFSLNYVRRWWFPALHSDRLVSLKMNYLSTSNTFLVSLIGIKYSDVPCIVIILFILFIIVYLLIKMFVNLDTYLQMQWETHLCVEFANPDRLWNSEMWTPLQWKWLSSSSLKQIRQYQR